MTAAALIALALVVAVAPTGDPDLWWHLQSGALGWSARPWRDPFSYSRAGALWSYRDLLADVILYRGFAAWSFGWLLALKVVAALVATGALVLAQPRAHRTALLALLGGGALLLTVPFVERPNLFTVACFPLLVALLDRARDDATATDPRALAARFVPPVLTAWAWICLHRAGALAPLLLAAFAGELALARTLARWRRLRAVLGEPPSARAVGAASLAALASGALAFANPAGAAAITTALGVAGSAALRASISEWQRLGPVALVHAFPATVALGGAALVAGAVSIARAARAGTPSPARGWHALLVLAFAGAALDSVRWVPYLATVAALGLARALAPGLAAPRVRARGSLAPLAFILVAVVLFAARAAPFRLGEDRDRLPSDACDDLARAGLDGRIANAFDHGGYLIWRRWPKNTVLVDGRNETVYPPALLEQALAAEHDPARFAAMREEDGATIVVAGNAPGRLTHGFLADDPRWALVSWSEAATVWVRADAHPQAAAQRYTRVDPRSIDGSVARIFRGGDPGAIARLEEELLRMGEASPTSVRVLVGLALCAHLRGDDAARERLLHRLDEVAPGHPAVRELRRRVAGQRS